MKDSLENKPNFLFHFNKLLLIDFIEKVMKLQPATEATQEFKHPK